MLDLHDVAESRPGAGAIGLATGMVAAVALLVVMGFELAILTSSTDTDAAVAQMIGLSTTSAFGIRCWSASAASS